MGVKKVTTLWVMIIILISTIPLSLQTAAQSEIELPSNPDYADDKNNTKDQDNRIAIIDTSYGIIKFELFEKRAPITSANFINLSKDFFYDGILFHRVIDDFVIQTGDPNSRDDENPYTFTFKCEQGGNKYNETEEAQQNNYITITETGTKDRPRPGSVPSGGTSMSSSSSSSSSSS